jgi:chemotaxis signal transduction protein
VSGVEATPNFGTRLAPEFLKGVCRKDDGFMLVLDIDRLSEADEVRVPTVTEAIGSI